VQRVRRVDVEEIAVMFCMRSHSGAVNAAAALGSPASLPNPHSPSRLTYHFLAFLQAERGDETVQV
jgi:hypothetical protein